MRSTRLLNTDDGRLRLVWTAVLFFAILFAGILSVRSAPQLRGIEMEFLAGWTTIASLLLVRWIERRPIATLGFRWNVFSARQSWGGVILGAGLFNLAIVAAYGLGDVEISFHHQETFPLILMIASAFISFLSAAAFEELVFRGYLFQIAMERLPVSAALAIFSIAFAGVHLGNPHISVLGIVNTLLAGLWFGGAFLRTRQLYLPIALHASWNFMQGAVWGAEVSGLRSGGSVFASSIAGPEWLTGGAYGIEGGVLCTAVVLLGIVLVQTSSLFQISPEQFALLHRVRYAEDHARVHPHPGHA